MPRSRAVLSFMSQWGAPNHHDRSPDSKAAEAAQHSPSYAPPAPPRTPTTPVSPAHPPNSSPLRRRRSSSRNGSRPTSMIQAWQPTNMEPQASTIPELAPIFAYLSSHGNKLYQEGYFLKLHDLDPRGRPSPDRSWQECFAQLVGTVLSIWDAAELDQAGEDHEVLPSFINLADASCKMLDSLPMNEDGGRTLQNVLSLSTAGNNRYLFHFSSFASMTQWTGSIRLAMYENVALQEAYTGSLIAGKGKHLNNIRQIMERSRMKYEDWARVRFGAGTPWRKCWFVVSPPDEKEYQKLQKATKKRSPYEKTPVLKGDLKFYESKKIGKKTKPIATITDAFSAYSIYPASKPLIEQSTLVKIEGKITIHADSESSTEGSVFVMPEMHPAVSGFEMMLRFLFPVWDTFSLYGRPNKLVADARDTRGLMFAMPKDRRYGYLEILDVSGLVSTEGSGNWSDREWRKKMKELTAQRMLVMAEAGDSDEYILNSRANLSRTSLPPARNGKLRFGDSSSGRSTPTGPEPRGLPDQTPTGKQAGGLQHRRSASEAFGYNRNVPATADRSTPQFDEDSPPAPPPHGEGLYTQSANPDILDRFETASDSSGKESGQKTPEQTVLPEVRALTERSPPPEPVAAPPSMAHGPSQKPQPRPQLLPGRQDLDRATLSQLEDMAGRPRHQSPSRQSPSRFGGPVRDPRQVGPNSPYGPYPEQRRSWASQEDGQSAGALGAPYQYPPQQKGRHPPPRLATIPASPFVDQNASPGNTSATSYFTQTQPVIPESESPAVRPAIPPPAGSGSNVQRKPVGSGVQISSRDGVVPNPAPTNSTPGGGVEAGMVNGSPRREESPGRARMDPNYAVRSSPGLPPQLPSLPPPGSPGHQQPRMGSPNHRPQNLGPHPNSPLGLQPKSYPSSPPALLSPGQQLPYSRSANASPNRDNPYYSQQPLSPPSNLPASTGPYGPVASGGSSEHLPNGTPFDFRKVQQQLPKEVMYGGELMPYEAAMDMKRLHLRMYGPQHVQAMERMPSIPAFRQQPAAQNNNGGQGQNPEQWI